MKQIYDVRLDRQITFRLTPEQVERIEKLRETTGRGTADILRDALDRYFDEMIFEVNRGAPVQMKAEGVSDGKRP
jgi:hypothetical protein